MTPTIYDLISDHHAKREAETSETLLTGRGVRLERIVSLGQVSPPGFWYDQGEAEWVMLVAGRARLTIAGESEDRHLQPGHAVYLPAGCRHRVAWTDPDQPTIWLALFVDPGLGPVVPPTIGWA